MHSFMNHERFILYFYFACVKIAEFQKKSGPYCLVLEGTQDTSVIDFHIFVFCMSHSMCSFRSCLNNAKASKYHRFIKYIRIMATSI